MKIRFTNPDPRDFPTLGLTEVKAGTLADVPAPAARDLVAQGVAVVPKPRTKPQPKTKTEE